MINPKEMSDKELAECLYELTGDAANSWNDFSEMDKVRFARLESEACLRFINEHMEAADDRCD